jgi:hypothetical protein
MEGLMKRFMLGGGAAVVVVVVLAGILVTAYASHLVRRGIEYGGNMATGLNTQVSHVDLGILSGQLRVAGMALDNPDGFDGDFIQLDSLEVAVSLRSLMSDEVEVPVLRLDGLDVTLLKNTKGANYKTVMGYMADHEKDESQKTEKGFVIRHLEINRIQAHVEVLTLGDKKARVDVEIPRIVLKDVGSNTDGGVVASELSSILVQAVLEAVVRRARNLPGGVLKDLRNGLVNLDNLANVGIEIDNLPKNTEGLKKKVDQEIEKGLEQLNPFKK